MLLGYSTKLIARVMLIGPRTVDSYRGNVLRKLNVGSTKELAYKLYDMEDKSHVSKA
jgi:DNA-binding CsgD family transcriptional regulator